MVCDLSPGTTGTWSNLSPLLIFTLMCCHVCWGFGFSGLGCRSFAFSAAVIGVVDMEVACAWV